MPLYEYECDACGHRFEVIQRVVSEPPVDKCPVCGGSVHKLQSAPAFQFKGTGWYVTDYARKDAGKSAKADGASGDAGKEKSDKEKGDKPAADKSEKKTSAGDAAKSSTSSTSSSKNS